MVSQAFDADRTDGRGIRVRPVGQGRPCLVMMTGAFPGETYLITPSSELTIGRGPGTDIRLPYTDVSRVHAKAKCSASGRVEIIDMGSMNGTFVNGRRQLYRMLREGDKIQFGERTVFRFAFHDELDEAFQATLLGAPFLDRATATQTRERLIAVAARALDEARRDGADFSLVVMAIDGFDLLEQLLGLAVRDYFLRELSWIIRKTVAGEATLYRVGPDAFATPFPGLSLRQATEVAERMRRVVASSRLTYEGDQMVFSLGLGVASTATERLASAEDMLALAESRCRRAAAAGGDRVEAVGGA